MIPANLRQLARGAIRLRLALTVVAIAATAACAHLPAAGPLTSDVLKPSGPPDKAPLYVLVDLTPEIASKLATGETPSLAAVFGDEPAADETRIKTGDYVNVMFWEAGSAAPMLGSDTGTASSTAVGHEVVPEQIVAPSDGMIAIPFVGRIHVAGLTIPEAEATARDALRGTASNPQVLITISRNTSNPVVVVGDDIKGLSYTLTPNQDRILDAIAAAGGVESPTYEAEVKLLRDGRSATMGLQQLLSNPSQNIHLHPHDVLVVSKNPEFFTALGALGHNTEVQFQNNRMNLAEALGLSGGLVDTQADPAGVFLFRYESKRQLRQACPACSLEGWPETVPVIYRLNMRHAQALRTARDFQVLDRDILYVSDAPQVQTAKFLSMMRDLFTPGLAAAVVARDLQH